VAVRFFRRTILLALLVLALPVQSALASHAQEASFQDNRLLLEDPANLDATLSSLKALGIRRLRISVVWQFIAPATNSRRRPAGFDAADPAAYPAAGWGPYDTIVRAAPRYGMKLNFDVGGGAPLWAAKRTSSAVLAHVWYPNARQFGEFVTAVAHRYDGTFTPAGETSPLPRVGYWSIWNEPNVGTSSLSPQTVHGREVGPRLYRSLADQAYAALGATGHAHDTILVGEMASTGHTDPGANLGMQPLRFLRSLFCVDAGYQELRGTAAAERGCPTTAEASQRFRAEHPVLFDATGWSHHPYWLDAAPATRAPPADADWVPLADLSKLERALDRVEALYGSHRKLDLYLTEYGFETNPPRPEFAVTPALQASYLNQAEFMAWSDPRVQSFSQYLLRDAPPGGGSKISSFASGLEFVDGRPKPAFAAYRLAVWLPVASTHDGRGIQVWGCVRPTARLSAGQLGAVRIELGGRTVRTVKLDNPDGYFDVRLDLPHGGPLRLAYDAPGGMIYSRTVTVAEAGGGGTGGAGWAIPIAIVAVAAGGLAARHLRRRRSSRLPA
jgi:hypothetical protein